MKHTIYIGSDHAGFALKQFVIETFKHEYDIIDCGPHDYQKHDDYPGYAQKVCEMLLKHHDRGILICDTGIGMSIAANRFKGVRAALVTSEFMAERSRLHNDANIICLGSELNSKENSVSLIKTWLTTDFEAAERHIRRLNEIERLV